MSFRRYFYTTLFIHLVIAQYPHQRQQDAVFDECQVTLGDGSTGIEYDLRGLSGERVISRVRDTPPTTMEDMLRFDLCAPLRFLDDVAEKDQVSLILLFELI